MAKCVVCKAENAHKEARIHPNAVTLATARLLDERVRTTNRREQPHRFCSRHLQSQPKVPGINTGTETLNNINESATATPILKEETTNGTSI